MRSRQRSALVATLAAVLMMTAGCTTPPGAPSHGSSEDPPNAAIAADGPVTGQGTVLQVGDAAPEFCLGAVALSAPPQCSGPELVGWDWDAVDGEESMGGATYGSYAVTGKWDGVRLTVTGSILLALYDPMPIADPLLDPGNAGDATDAELTKIQDQLSDTKSFPFLESHIENGYLFVRVLYDDGSIQRWVDERFLPDRVAIRSALVSLS